MPNLLDLRPVEMKGWVPASTSRLMRKLIEAVRFSCTAHAESTSSSASLSTLKQSTPASSRGSRCGVRPAAAWPCRTAGGRDRAGCRRGTCSRRRLGQGERAFLATAAGRRGGEQASPYRGRREPTAHYTSLTPQHRVDS